MYPRGISGRLRLDIRPLQLTEVLESAIETIRPAADAKQVRLQALLDPAASAMAGDPDRLRQVFWNLLSNAVKFTPKDGRIQVCSQRIDSHVEIIVSDTGLGIEPQLIPYVFDRFRQGDSGTNRRSTGLGLGLAIVSNLVELHGGSAHAESNGGGQGATFTIRLPIMMAPDRGASEDRVHPAVTDPIALEGGPFLKNLRVLLVDDENGAREIAATILMQAQAEVRTADRARAALEILDEWRPDVLVADIGMPDADADGYGLIRQVRARSPQNGGKRPGRGVDGLRPHAGPYARAFSGLSNAYSQADPTRRACDGRRQHGKKDRMKEAHDIMCRFGGPSNICDPPFGFRFFDPC
jgi:CheY-like chemotaxis protein/two-component sensor histidine kinase